MMKWQIILIIVLNCEGIKTQFFAFFLSLFNLMQTSIPNEFCEWFPEVDLCSVDIHFILFKKTFPSIPWKYLIQFNTSHTWS